MTGLVVNKQIGAKITPAECLYNVSLQLKLIRQERDYSWMNVVSAVGIAYQRCETSLQLHDRRVFKISRVFSFPLRWKQSRAAIRI